MLAMNVIDLELRTEQSEDWDQLDWLMSKPELIIDAEEYL